MSLLDSFITLMFLSAMLLCLVFMCRDRLKRSQPISGIRPHIKHSYTPVFPRVSKKKDKREENESKV